MLSAFIRQAESQLDSAHGERRAELARLLHFLTQRLARAILRECGGLAIGGKDIANE